MRKIFLILTVVLLNVITFRAQNNIRFGVISDMHTGITPILGAGNNLCLQNAFDYFSIPKLHLDRVVAVGDFTDYGTWNEFEVFRRIKEQHLRVPLLASMGNHDANNWDFFEKATGCKGNDVNVINGFYFITVSPGAGTLDTITKRATDYNVDAYEYIRDWLHEQVVKAKTASGKKPVFVFAHHPLSKNPGLKGLFDNDPQVIYFSGHIHLPNNSPLGIRQDDGFTEVNTAVTGLVAQGLLVDADKKGNVKITTHDFNRGIKIQEWQFNIHKTLPYTDSIRMPQSQAPEFVSDAGIKVKNITTNTAVLTFKNAIIPTPNPVNNIVFKYRSELIEKATGKQVKHFEFQPNLFSDTIKLNLRGLQKNTEYEVRVYALDAWLKESTQYISTTFKTIEKNVILPKPFDYKLCFDGDLSNGKNHAVRMYRQDVNPGLYDTIPHFETGIHGQAIDLSSLNFVELDSEIDPIDYGQSFSIAFWMNVKTVRNDGEAAILSNRNVNREYYNGFSFRTFNNNGINFICLEYSPVNGKYTRLPLTPTPIGQWIHLAATFDYTQNRIKVYVNGVVVKNVEAELSGGIGGISDECPFKTTFLGSSPWNYSIERGGYNGCGKGNNDIRFLVDDFVMSSRVFSQEDVLALSVGLGTTIYPSSVRLNKGDHLSFVAEAPVTEENRQVTWSVSGNTSSQTGITADGMLSIGPDEKASSLAITATSSNGIKGTSVVTVTTPRSDGKINFGVITDVHVGGNININTGNNQRLAKAFEFFNDPALQTERVVLTGDLGGIGIWPELFIFRMIRQRTLQVPSLIMMGNHEENKWENFERATGNKPNEVNIINGYYFITVSPGDGQLNEMTMRATDKNQNKYAYIQEWLEARIIEAETASPDKPIFVFQHHAVTGPEHDLYNMLCNHHRVVIFSGDTHDVNNHPLSIRQDGGFTWVHAGAICSEAEFNNTSEGLYVEADDRGNVTIKTRDFTNNRWIENQVWKFNVNKPTLYTEARRRPLAHAPFFAPDAEVRLTEVRPKSIVVEFDCPLIPDNQVNDIVYRYRYKLTKKKNGKVVKDLSEWADFCLYPPSRTKTIEFIGLEKATAYTLNIYGIDAWGKESKPLTASFSTATIDTIPRKPINYVLHFDGSLKNEGTSPKEVKMFFLDSKPEIYDTIPHFEAGRHGQAISLNNLNFVTLDNNNDLIDYDQSFSVAFWMKITKVLNEGRPGILSNRNADGAAFNGYTFRTGDNNGINYLYFEITPVNDEYKRLWLAPTKLNKWMHIAATFDYEQNKVTLYADGKQIHKVDVNLSGGIGGITGKDRNKATFLGSSPWLYTEEHGGYNGGHKIVNFLADDFIMINRVWTPEDVEALCQ
mgnify:CR=1 FL=1